MSKKSWVFRLPPGFREQPAGAFIGLFCSLGGLNYLLGTAESTSITRVLDPEWMRVWGGSMFVAGALVLGAIFAYNRPLELLASRLLSLSALVYMGWIIAAVPLKNAAMMIVLCLVIVAVLEVRVGVIKTLLKPLPRMYGEGEEWTPKQ